jgi:hypothetical protein
MADDFRYDVFLSHSAKDKTVVLAVAERLRADKLRVWLDEWEIKPGDNIPSKIEEGLEHSRVLVGEVISAVALAGQICRELTVSDNGIDMGIEFKSNDGKATGQKLYLQLKSGDSYLKERKSDGAEIFKIEETRHADYWREQPFPVLLVIRTSDGEVRWMEIRDSLDARKR